MMNKARKEIISTSDLRTYDRLIGQNLKNIRKELGLTQPYLAQNIGVSFQQIQKYESGDNRLSISRALLSAYVMEIPVSAFYQSAFTQLQLDMKKKGGAFNSKVL